MNPENTVGPSATPDIPLAPPNGELGTWVEWGVRYGNRVLHPFRSKAHAQDYQEQLDIFEEHRGEIVCRAVTPWEKSETPPNAISLETLHALVESYDTLWAVFGSGHWTDGKDGDACHTSHEYRERTLRSLDTYRKFVRAEMDKRGW